MNPFQQPTIIVLLLAAFLDYLIGDPKNWLHPVQVMGWVINKVTNKIICRYEGKNARRLGGIFLGASLTISSALITWLLVLGAESINYYFSICLQIILLASCFAGKSLRRAVGEVLEPLQEKNLATARTTLSYYVGRDTQDLGGEEISRALLETVAENTPDGVTATLFYALWGAFLSIGPVPLAFAYKAISTLDSMVGYRREPYTHIGWFSARCEDYLTWLPCRLTVLTLALISGKPRETLRICLRDAPKDPSPNSGWSESAYAAILGVQLGGVNTYKGVVREKPLLGDPINAITPEAIEKALQLTRYCFLLWLILGVLIMTSH
ncbi:MAG: Cobalamin biosynthesis protein CobD [Chroococcopsis gigantea SAG 12.99]|jgi:adenosylcobinamide-phosphate synthase|nr:cobalamin biosynthesis protein [Chlorogloea purpurea SAG 13.99]MDV2998982.1 Cobalamin biosynthesis protein CobD [Chroococcopsis gigantea SAG 12.99]